MYYKTKNTCNLDTVISINFYLNWVQHVTLLESSNNGTRNVSNDILCTFLLNYELYFFWVIHPTASVFSSCQKKKVVRLITGSKNKYSCHELFIKLNIFTLKICDYVAITSCVTCCYGQVLYHVVPCYAFCGLTEYE